MSETVSFGHSQLPIKYKRKMKIKQITCLLSLTLPIALVGCGYGNARVKADDSATANAVGRKHLFNDWKIM